MRGTDPGLIAIVPTKDEDYAQVALTDKSGNTLLKVIANDAMDFRRELREVTTILAIQRANKLIATK